MVAHIYFLISVECTFRTELQMLRSALKLSDGVHIIHIQLRITIDEHKTKPENNGTSKKGHYILPKHRSAIHCMFVCNAL